MKVILSIPNADRTFAALRSLGYDLNASIADLIDNSITAKAKKVRIDLSRDKDTFTLVIKDDGKGMNDTQLKEAMRIGTNQAYVEGDLGRFGLGMKTASLSHCNILTVISKNKTSNISGYRWDMEHVSETNEWGLLKLNKKEIDEILLRKNLQIRGPGTVILWDEIFTLDNNYISYKNKKFAEGYRVRTIKELRVYINTVFHRFLDGNLAKKRSLTIYLNKERLKGWDPFCRSEKETTKVKLKEEISQFYIDEYKKPIKVNGYILPSREQFSSDKAWKNAKGILSWNDAQGYYIYRENRVIRFGGWQRTKARDEHDKLARVSIDIGREMDKLFRINVNKNQVHFPELLYHHLKNRVNSKIVTEAQKRYRKTDGRKKIKNKIRTYSNKLETISKAVVREGKIKTSLADGTSDSVKVTNPSGEFLSNKVKEFLNYGTNKDFEIISEKLENNHLWKIICNTDEKFKVIVNINHPFYKAVYENNDNKELTNAVDALIFSLAFAELYNKNEHNENLFNVYKSITSTTLEKLIKENII